MRDDFQGEGLGQWASYPPAQDIGYEPSISPTSDYGAPGGRALMRVVKPNRAGAQRFGFIKKVRGIVASDPRLRFAYRLNSPSPATIEVGLAGIDGRLYTNKLTGKTNYWSVTDFALGEFRVPVGVSIEAIYIVAVIPNVDPDFTYRFLIDDVIFSAVTEASFAVTIPRAELIEPWPSLISGKSYRQGDSIVLEARAPSRLTKSECSLTTQTGQTISTERLYDDGTHGDKTAGDNVWTNNKLYQLRGADPAGVWLARLRGTTSDGQSVETVIRLIVRPASATDHPRLFFSATDREKLIARSRDPKLVSLWTNLQTTAKTTRTSGDISDGGKVFELLDSEYLLPSLLGYFDVLNRARTRIGYNAFVAYLTDDAEARNAAKDAMLAVSRWGRWEPPWFTAHGQHTYYPAGLLAVDVALGYDLLYDHLTEVERSQIRRALIQKQIIPTYREYFLDNRAMANTSNWISHTVGGALIAASAIAGDVTPEESGGKFNLYVNGLLMKIEAHMAASHLPDGSYGEGISYQEFDSETLAPMINAVERNFGVDYWNTTSVKDSLRYSLYTLTEPREASPDMGDTHPSAGHGIAPIIFRSKDPVMRWFYSRFDRPSIQQFIFYDDSVQPKSPAAAGIPTSTTFEDKGNAELRTGWGEESITMLFRAGPTFNHHHADQGSFL